MTVVDTDVLSALMRREINPIVIAWLDRQPAESIWTTAITEFEVRFGLDLLPSGRRKRQLQHAFELVLNEDFQGRILPFDSGAAAVAAGLAARRRSDGKPVDFRDIEIAGIASVRRATLATRNTRHFEDLGIEIVNPWDTA
ncbi:MAG: type II toxin-antitoxin system VapC family toxin [Gammaproteobacteria bacterium]